MSYDSLRDASKIVNFSEARAERLEGVKKAKEILEDGEASLEEKQIAEDFLNQSISWEEDQMIVKDLLESID